MVMEVVIAIAMNETMVKGTMVKRAMVKGAMVKGAMVSSEEALATIVKTIAVGKNHFSMPSGKARMSSGNARMSSAAESPHAMCE
jgi:hypothetical protein